MNKPYTVALESALEVPMHQRIEAEVRFARELDQVLGGGEYVAETYAAWLTVTQGDANQIDRATAISAARWPVALNAAMRAGLSKVGDIGKAHFEVRLAHR
jgi:hypothetical protein